MKIRKFNESVENFDMEFVHECFIDFEDSKFKISFELAPNNLSIDVEFDLRLRFPQFLQHKKGGFVYQLL